jgi:Zn-dependent M28 family amino/carboxypeptidase
VIDTKTLKIKADAEGPGADNNGTGIAMMLAMIELFQTMDLPKTVRFVFLDYGEIAYLGAHSYAESIAKDKKPLGILNFLMLGNDTKRDKEKKLGNMKVYMRKSDEAGFDQDSALADLINSRGAKYNSQVKFAPTANGFDSYGHVFFWKLGIPSLVFTQDWEDDFNEARYHTSNDFPETLNLKTFNNSFEYLTGAIISWAFDINR